MSNAFSSERSIPTLLLIVFIVIILVFGVTAYVVYTEKDRLEKKLDSDRQSLQKSENGLNTAQTQLNDLYDAMGFKTLQEVDQAFAASAVPVDPKILENLIAEGLKKREELIKQIGVNPLDVDESGKSLFLEQTITAARRSGTVADNLKGTLVGNLVEQYILLDKAVVARAGYVTQGEDDVKAVQKDIDAQKAKIKSEFARLDTQAAEAWDARVVEQNRLRIEQPQWDAEREVLTRKRDLDQAINRKLEERLKLQKDMGTPLDGVILTYDWRSRRGTVNLGAVDRVKAGYAFDVFTVRPGGDTAENRVYRGRIRLLNVNPESSLFAVIPSQWDSEKTPIMEGQRVCSQIYDNTGRRSFCLKGWFPEGGDHSKQALEGMIFRAGGVVQEETTLDTDFLVVGVISEEGLTNLSLQAKAAIAEGAKAYDDARHCYITVLTVEKLFRYWDDAGTRAER